MTTRITALAGFSLAVAALAAQPGDLQAQRDLPLSPVQATNNFVAPYFDGWIEHEDGSRTFSFAFLNRNASGAIEIPIGPDNFIEPAEFNGMQPTYFPVVSYPGFGGPRERGAFGITVPPGFTGDVVWTLRNPNGTVTSVPGRASSVAYELSSTPQASGSQRPLVRFSADGEANWGPKGIVSEERLTTTVGEALALTAWGEDRGDREPGAMNLTWFKHQGPVGGEVVFEPASMRIESDGEAANHGTVMATFSEPGDYMLRVRVDNFPAPDSNFGNQCCWSNGFVQVTVQP
jgi:hypothetical protein